MTSSVSHNAVDVLRRTSGSGSRGQRAAAGQDDSERDVQGEDGDEGRDEEADHQAGGSSAK